jgi:hypothetical protein
MITKHFKSMIRKDMMEIFKKQINIYLYKIIVVSVLFVICVVAVIYFYSKASSPVTPLLGGLTTGLFVALLQLLLMWTEHKEMENIKKLGIKDILSHRDDESLYGKVIARAEKEIYVLGNTAFRFMEDFADDSRSDKMALIAALNKNVKVRFLLPHPDYLWKLNDKDRATVSLRSIEKLKEKYNTLVELKYYSHAPFHSMVLADNDCFVGPIFPDKTSKNTPTIYTDRNSVFAKPYLDYFDFEWGKAKPCP